MVIYLWCNNNIQLQTMLRPFPDINQPIYAPDKTELRNKVSLLTSSIIHLLQYNNKLTISFFKLD